MYLCQTVIVFRERTNHFYLDEDFSRVHAATPIQMPSECLLSLFKLPTLADWEYYCNYEDFHHVKINFYELKSQVHHKKTEWKGQESWNVPGNHRDIDWEPKAVINIGIKSWPAESIWWLPSDNLILTKFTCTKFPGICQFECTRQTYLDRHIETCEAETQISSRRKYYGQSQTIMDEICDKGYLPSHFRHFRVTDLATVDIETCQTNDILKPISIAVGSTFEPPKYFERRLSSAKDFQILINEFMTYLFELHEQIQMPDEIIDAIEQLSNEQRSQKFSSEQSKKQTYKRHLQKYSQLNCYGFNSSKFDMPCIIGGMVRYGKDRKLETKVLKKTSKYLTIQIGGIIFKDILNYTSPCSLSKYLKQWNAPEAKGIFPHGYFKSIEEIRTQVKFPPYEAFFSELKQSNVPENEYKESKLLYDQRCSLPDDHEDKWYNFSDYLKHYNMLDVAPLVKAISNSFGKFFEHFGIDPCTRLSLPSIAFEAMFGLFDQSLPYVATVCGKSDAVRRLFKQNAHGGITNVYCRHIDLMTESSPHNARFAPNGCRYKCCFFSDINSMYTWGEDQDLPLTSGIHWTLNGQKFQKKVLSTHVSFSAIQWLYFEEQSDRCVDSNGIRQPIHHEYFQGEKHVHGYKVDGYAKIDGIDTVWEFNGCYWHGCLECDPELLAGADENQLDRYHKTQTKIQMLRQKGCKVYVMKECIWRDLVKSYGDVETKMARILNQDTQETLLSAIASGEVFGFAVCSVRTPDHLMKKFQDAEFLFPPIIKKAEITEDLMSPFMKQQLLEQDIKYKSNTLIQTYHGEDLLLMTPTLQFYLEQGLEVYDIKEFIQYVPGKGFAPFVSKVVQMRVDATREGDEAKQLTAKLFANSGTIII